MKNSKILMAILSGLLALATQGFGQNVFHVTFTGSCVTTNDNGNIVSTKLNNKALIEDAVTATGATNSSKLAVVYVQNASADPATPGDFIEVVNTTDGTSVYTNLLFLYNSPFPALLVNGDGTRFAAGAQVVPLPLAGSGDTLGGASINGRINPKSKTIIHGTFNYTSLRSPLANFNDEVKICNGSFETGKAFVPK